MTGNPSHLDLIIGLVQHHCEDIDDALEWLHEKDPTTNWRAAVYGVCECGRSDWWVRHSGKCWECDPPPPLTPAQAEMQKALLDVTIPMIKDTLERPAVLLKYLKD